MINIDDDKAKLKDLQEILSLMRDYRNRNLIKNIYKEKCKTIVEIGTYYGTNAVFMTKMAKKLYNKKDVKYYGFDLFELFTLEDMEKEFSKEPPLPTCDTST